MYLRLLFIVSFLLLLGVLSGCASVQVDSSPSLTMAEKAESEKGSTEPEQVATNISAELLYSILGGELLGQRGDFNNATAFYIHAAKKSKHPQVAYRAVQIALFNKDIAAAKSVVDILLEGDQPSAELSRLALNVYLRAGDADNSLQQAFLLLAMPDVPLRNNLLAIGDMVLRTASPQTAVTVIDAITDKYPNQAASHLVKSQVAFQFKNSKQAIKYAEQATKLAPQWAIAYVQLARTLEADGQSGLALTVLEEASSRFSDKTLTMGYGQLLAKAARYEQAKEVFVGLVNESDVNHEARFALALVYLKLEKGDEAVREFKVLYEVTAYTSKSAFYLGQIYYQQQNYGDAATWFDRVAGGSLFIDAKSRAALSKARQGDLPAARERLQELRRIQPSSANRFYVLEGELLMNENQFSELFVLMSQAIKSDPDNLVLRYTRSLASAELDKIDLAEQDLEMILAKEPNNVNALNALGYTLASKTFRFDEARELLDKAMSLRAGDAAIMDSLGWLNFRSGRYEEALVLLQQAYAKEPASEIALHLGETLWVLGRQDEAKKIWLETIARDPNDKYSLEISKKLK